MSGDAVADELSLPLDRISLEMIDRGLSESNSHALQYLNCTV